MENASKALIIAGAILISILIIAIGMYIYTSSTSSINGAIAGMDKQEIQAANSQWLNYEGKQKGTQVKTLITDIIANAEIFKDEQHKVVGLGASANYDGNGHAATSSMWGAAPNPAPAVPAAAQGQAGHPAFTWVGTTDANFRTFITNLQTIQSGIRPQHEYTVFLNYLGTSLIREIYIVW